MKMGKTYKAPSLNVKEKPKQTQEEMAKMLTGDKKKAISKNKL